MSRTYRRTDRHGKAIKPYSDLDREEEWWVNYLMKRYRCSDRRKLLKVLAAKFHADRGQYNAPRFYRHWLSTYVKRENQRLLHHAIRQDEYDNLTLTPYKKNANYYYW